jgi:hypothetical protein
MPQPSYHTQHSLLGSQKAKGKRQLILPHFLVPQGKKQGSRPNGSISNIPKDSDRVDASPIVNLSLVITAVRL